MYFFELNLITIPNNWTIMKVYNFVFPRIVNIWQIYNSKKYLDPNQNLYIKEYLKKSLVWCKLYVSYTSNFNNFFVYILDRNSKLIIN